MDHLAHNSNMNIYKVWIMIICETYPRTIEITDPDIPVMASISDAIDSKVPMAYINPS